MDITGIIATMATVGLGVSLVWTKVETVVKALKELADVLTAITNALSDQKLTTEEIATIKKEAGEAIAAFKAIIGR